MEIHINEIKSFLKNNYYPFSRLSDAALEQSWAVLRTFELRQGEKIVIGGASNSEDYLYLVKGSIKILKGSDILHKDINNITEQPFLFPRLPETLTIFATDDAIICHADNEALDNLGAEEILTAIHNTATFRHLPMEMVKEAVKRMRKIHVTSGTNVIRQDEKGDSFFIILSGHAEVWKEKIEEDTPKMVDTMGPGEAFGEEALLMGAARNATIRMVSDATLVTMNQEDFNELISISLIKRVNAEIAKAMIDSGHQLLDVRYEEEYEKRFIPGSILIPLPELRKRYTELDPKKPHVIMCAGGLRASVAALLLKQRNFEVSAIEGGMRDWPFETHKNLELELILFYFCPYAQQILITLLYNDNQHKLTVIDPDNLPSWFEQVSPLKKVPILRVEDKDSIFEASVINDYLNQISSNRLLPRNPLRQAQCRSWIEFGTTCLSNFMEMICASGDEKFHEARDSLLKNLRILEMQVDKAGPYFDGEQFTLVDSTYAPLFFRMKYLSDIVKFYEPEELPQIKSWSENLLALDAVKNSVVGDFSKIFQDFVHRKGKGGYIDRNFLGMVQNNTFAKRF